MEPKHDNVTRVGDTLQLDIDPEDAMHIDCAGGVLPRVVSSRVSRIDRSAGREARALLANIRKRYVQ